METHLLLSVRVELAPASDVEPILAMCDDEGKMLAGLMRSLEVE